MKFRKSLLLAGYLLGQAVTGFAQFNQDAFKNATVSEITQRSDISQQELEGLVHYFRFTVKDEKRADELESWLVKKDPKGAYARMIAFSYVQKGKSNADLIARGEQFLKDFPIKEWNDNPHRQEFIYYSTYRTLGAAYFDTKKFDQFNALALTGNFKTENELFRWNIMRAYIFKMVRYDSLYNIAKPHINDLVAKVKDGSYIEQNVFTPEKAQENANEQLDNELKVYIQLLNSLGKYKEGLSYYQYFSEKGQYGYAEMNELHMQMLDKVGETTAIQPLLEKSIKANAVTPAMFEKLKALYQEQHKNLDGYDAYVASFRSVDEQKELQEYAKEHFMNKEYRPFALEKAGGGIVRSSDWYDKIVVIDFWATWCKPCIAAFPGMQMLIDKYSKDSSVGVYMIGTMQFGDYKKKSEDYVKQQGFRFNLLHDAVNKTTGEQDAVFKTFVPFFNSSAIPRKLVLKDGLIRYSTEGYSGSPSKLVDELSYVIETLKAEK